MGILSIRLLSAILLVPGVLVCGATLGGALLQDIQERGLGQSVEFEYPDANLEQRRVRYRDGGSQELVTLVQNGPPSNRIDIVVLGDGYTEKERSKFFGDARTLVHKTFKTGTLRSVLPLLNVHAVFCPSTDSGIDQGFANEKDTAYEMHRPDSFRAVFVSDWAAVEESGKVAPDCDYTVIMGNDPFYGGFGFRRYNAVATTSSSTSGSMVVRHELGHLFDVGDEYDGNPSIFYGGVNFTPLGGACRWEHWLDGPFSPGQAASRLLERPNHDLGDGPVTLSFHAEGWEHLEIHLSAAGVAEGLRVKLDNNDIPIRSAGHDDRQFFVHLQNGVSPGMHTLRIREVDDDGDNLLLTARVYEYGHGFHFGDHVGGFTIFDSARDAVGFRPTFDLCAMRRLTSIEYCPVCREQVWRHFLERTSLVDRFTLTQHSGFVTANVTIPKLGQFRQGSQIPGERLGITWRHNGEMVPELSGRLSWRRPEHECWGRWRLDVALTTPEVRSAEYDLLHYTAVRQVTPSIPRLVVDPAEVDLGQVAVDVTSSTRQVKATNYSTSPVEIQRVWLRSGDEQARFLVVQPQVPLTIAPLEQAVVAGVAARPSARGSFEGIMEIRYRFTGGSASITRRKSVPLRVRGI